MPGFSLGLVVVPRNHRKANHAAILLLPLGNGLEIFYDEFVVSSRVLPIHLLIHILDINVQRICYGKKLVNKFEWDMERRFQIDTPIGPA